MLEAGVEKQLRSSSSDGPAGLQLVFQRAGCGVGLHLTPCLHTHASIEDIEFRTHTMFLLGTILEGISQRSFALLYTSLLGLYITIFASQDLRPFLHADHRVVFRSSIYFLLLFGDYLDYLQQVSCLLITIVRLLHGLDLRSPQVTYSYRVVSLDSSKVRLVPV